MPSPRSSASCVDLDDGDGDAGVGEVHGDAAAHGAGADDRRLLDVLGRRVGRHVGDLGRLALGEEEVALGLGLGRGDQLAEELALPLDALVERQAHGRLDRLDACSPARWKPRVWRATDLRNSANTSGLPRAAASLSSRSRIFRSGRFSFSTFSANATPAAVRSPSTISSMRPDLERLVGADRIAAHHHLQAPSRRRPRGAAAACRRRRGGGRASPRAGRSARPSRRPGSGRPA